MSFGNSVYSRICFHHTNHNKACNINLFSKQQVVFSAIFAAVVRYMMCEFL